MEKNEIIAARPSIAEPVKYHCPVSRTKIKSFSRNHNSLMPSLDCWWIPRQQEQREKHVLMLQKTQGFYFFCQEVIHKFRCNKLCRHTELKFFQIFMWWNLNFSPRRIYRGDILQMILLRHLDNRIDSLQYKTWTERAVNLAAQWCKDKRSDKCRGGRER